MSTILKVMGASAFLMLPTLSCNSTTLTVGHSTPAESSEDTAIQMFADKVAEKTTEGFRGAHRMLVSTRPPSA